MATFQKDYFNDNSLDPVWTESYQTGGSSDENGSYLIITSGDNDCWYTGFNASGVYQGSISGDFDVKVKIADCSLSSPNRTGIAVYFSATEHIGLTNDEGGWYKDGGSSSSTGDSDINPPRYYRAKRVDTSDVQLVTVYSSSNGTDWTAEKSHAFDTSDVQIWLYANDNGGTGFTTSFDAAVNFSDPWAPPIPIITLSPSGSLSPSGNNLGTNPDDDTFTVTNSAGASGSELNWEATLTDQTSASTYYFDDWDDGNPGFWDANGANVVDGSLSTYGNDNNDGHYIHLTSNTCSASGDINTVKVRIYWENNYDANPDRTIAPYLIPYFNGSTVGSSYGPTPGNYDGSESYPKWSAYYDITNDANGPGEGNWILSDVTNLDLRVESNRPNTGIMNIYKIEIETEITLESYNNDVITLSPSSGSEPASGSGDIVTISYNSQSVNRGTYYKTISVADLNASNSPQIIDVTLTITGSASSDGVSSNDALEIEDTASATHIMPNSPSGSLAIADSIEYYFDEDAFTWGEESPSGGDLGVSWSQWVDEEAATAPTSGSTDWGKLEFWSDERMYSPVVRIKSNSEIKVERERYGAGKGNINTYIRGQSTTFTQTTPSGTLAWESYASPVVKSWQYVQVMIEGL